MRVDNKPGAGGLAAPQVKGGKLDALATSGGARSAALPQEIVNKLNADLDKIVTAPDNRQRLEEAGYRVTGTSRQEFTRIIAEDTLNWGKAVRATGFKAD